MGLFKNIFKTKEKPIIYHEGIFGTHKLMNRYNLTNPKLVYSNGKPHIVSHQGKVAPSDKKEDILKFLESQQVGHKWLTTSYPETPVVFGYDEDNIIKKGKASIYIMAKHVLKTFDNLDDMWDYFEKHYRNL